MTVKCWLERRLAMLIATYYAAAIAALPDDEPDVCRLAGARHQCRTSACPLVRATRSAPTRRVGVGESQAYPRGFEHPDMFAALAEPTRIAVRVWALSTGTAARQRCCVTPHRN
jgi:hypothetical protein